MPVSTEDTLVYGDGSNKIFGMENFGNTCYCNSILQCLYYTESFRISLLKHNYTKHEPKLSVVGSKPHIFTSKYEQLVAKRIKEQGGRSNVNNATAGGTDERPKPTKKGSLFNFKFNSSSSDSNQMISASSGDENKKSYIMEAKYCEALSSHQRLKLMSSPGFQELPVLVSRPLTEPENISDYNDNSMSSSLLLNNDSQQQVQHNGTISHHSSIVVVGIPYAEPFLVNPINPYNANPSPDQRKRSALINGPIVNVDSSLTPLDQRPDDAALCYALKDLYESMVENKSLSGVVSPTYFVNKLKERNFLFRQNNMHQDAHEFFNYLLNEIIESVNQEVGVDKNWCNQIFQGVITNETKCLSCETITAMHELFLDLSIDIPPGESTYSLSYSLNNFSKQEVLSNQNKFYCNTCCSLQEATKTIKLNKLPQVLVINFKRFKYDENVDKMVKLFDSISYPFHLRLFNTTDDEKEFILYDLYALVVHIGGGPMHGHYVALCKIKIGLWLLFDDETVEIVGDSYVMRFFGNGPGLASAYILFYNKCNDVQYLQDSGADTVDFGFNPNDIYKGEEFSLFQQLDTLRNDSVSSRFSTKEEEEIPSDSASTETVSTSIPNSSVEPKKSAQNLFKKNSKPLLRDDKPESKGSLALSKDKEKKTWVGSLKRRDNKNDGQEEKKSGPSTTGTQEKKKSIFSFKRK